MKNVIILEYHKVNDSKKTALDVPLKNFEAQMIYLQNQGYKVISLNELIEEIKEKRILAEKKAVITFDDGHRDNYIYAFPLLKKYNFTASIFLAVSFIDTPSFLGWKEIEEMDKAGISFGSHTITHPHLTQISKDEARNEIWQSKGSLERRIGKPCRFFCYPYGDVNDEIKEIVRKCGYRGAVITPTRPGIKEDLFCLKRLGVYCHTNMVQFRLKLWGVYRWLKRR